MGLVSIIKNAALFAFSNPLCDGLEKRVLSCEESIAIQQELLDEEQQLLKEEDELFQRVSDLQNIILSKASTLEESNDRAVLVLGDDSALASKCKQIQSVATRLVGEIKVNRQDLQGDLAKLKESATLLEDAKVKMGQVCISSDKIQIKR